MILFHSPLTAALLIAAVTLVLIGAYVKKGHVLSFLGALACSLAALTALLNGADWQEALLCVLLTLLAAALPSLMKGGRDG